MNHEYIAVIMNGTSSILGWIGSITYLIAYLLLSLNKLKASRPLYHILNIIGATGLIIHAIHLKDYPNLVVNTAWGIIAVIAIERITKGKGR